MSEELDSTMNSANTLLVMCDKLIIERDKLKAMNAELVEVVAAYVDYDEGDHEDSILMMLHYDDMLKAARAILEKNRGEPE